MAQEHVFEDAVHIRVHILIADKRTNRPELLRNLRVERRHVESDVALLERVPDEKTFAHELNALSNVDHISVHKRLTDSYLWPKLYGADLVVLERTSDLLPSPHLRT